MTERCYLGVDVGTASTRAALFDREGRTLGVGTQAIQIWRPAEDFVEQSSADIWAACGSATRAALQQANVDPRAVVGVGFDATCSLVALDRENRPVSVSPTGRDEQNVVVWMDHRALEQAHRINQTGHEVLRYVGGGVSPEMQTPKLLWLKSHLADCWKRTARFMDLPDFLTYAATGNDTRSLCTTVCKWTYLGHPSESGENRCGWQADFFDRIGMGELLDNDHLRIGQRVRPMGERLGGLTPEAARELGLRPGTAVGVGMIDAHAGGLGLLGTPLFGERPTAETLEQRIVLISGTSSCHMAVSRTPRFVPGVWGPYYSAMVPGLWLTEGGQSATGALIDHIIGTDARSAPLRDLATQRRTTVYAILNERLEQLGHKVAFPAELTRELHVLPYFHGNRSPRADPTLCGTISGLRLHDSTDALALRYLATIQAIAHGTRHILETLNAHGYSINTVLACGGDTKNPVFVREHADICGCRVVLPREPEAVLLGSAMLGAVASGDQPSVLEAMAAMSAPEQVIAPAGGAVAEYHAQKYAVFHRMYDDQLTYRRLMGDTRLGGSDVVTEAETE